MTTRYEIKRDPDGAFDVVAYHDNGQFEAWGSFDTKAEAQQSIQQHQARQRHAH